MEDTLTVRPDARATRSSASWSLGLIALPAGALLLLADAPLIFTLSVLVVFVALARAHAGRFDLFIMAPLAIWLLIGLAGLATDWSKHGKIVPYVAQVSTLPQRNEVTSLFVSCALAFVMGSVLIPTARGSLTPLVRARITASPRILIAAAVASPVLNFVAFGDSLLSRSTYLSGGRGGITSLASASVLPGAVVVGMLIGTAKRAYLRWIGVFLALTYMAIQFGLGSRKLSLIPVAIALGLSLSGIETLRKTTFTGSGLLSLALVPVPLYMRGLDSHGIFPYLPNLPDALGARSFSGPILNVLSSYTITAQTAKSAPLPNHWLFIEVNPAPGQAAGYYDIFGSLGLNSYTPFSAIGEMALHPRLFTLLLFGAFGLVCSYLSRRSNALGQIGLPQVGPVFLALVLLFAIQSLQYDLRTTSRFLWYAIALDLGARVVVALRAGKDQLR